MTGDTSPSDLIAELRAMIDHDASLGLRPPLHAEIRTLLDHIAALEERALKAEEALKQAKQALEYSSSSLDSITTYDEEDMAPDGGSSACQANIKINKRAIAGIDACLTRSLASRGTE
jgi:hypothetical protein